MRYQSTIGRFGNRSVFYVVDTEYPTSKRPVILFSYLTHVVAQTKADALNKEDRKPAF